MSGVAWQTYVGDARVTFNHSAESDEKFDPKVDFGPATGPALARHGTPPAGYPTRHDIMLHVGLSAGTAAYPQYPQGIASHSVRHPVRRVLIGMALVRIRSGLPRSKHNSNGAE